MNKNKERMLQILGQRLRQSDEAIKNITEGVKFLPQIEKEKEITQTHIKLIENIPDEYDIPEEFIFLAESEQKSYVSIYGPLIGNKVSHRPYQTPLISGMTSSFAFIDHISHEEKYTKSGMTWANESKTIYIDLHKKQNIQKETADLIRKLNPEIAAEFELSMDDRSKVKTGIIKINDIAIRYRTIMEKVKGDLKSKLNIQSKDNKIFDELADNYSDGVGGSDHAILVIEKARYDTLHDEFSNIGKLNKKLNIADFETLSIQFVDNIYAILSIIARHTTDIF